MASGKSAGKMKKTRQNHPPGSTKVYIKYSTNQKVEILTSGHLLFS